MTQEGGNRKCYAYLKVYTENNAKHSLDRQLPAPTVDA